jgi:hypothetical protein
MGDFFAPPPGYSPLPPEPDSPLPDFETIGTNIGLGLDKSGALNGFLSGLWQWLLKWSIALIAWVLRNIIKLLAYIFGLLGDITNDTAAGYGPLVAVTLKDLFGVDVDPASVGTRQGGANRQAVANQLGQAIIGTLFSQVAANPAGGITPSDAAANQFLAVMMNMELNGWVESWFTDAASVHLLEKWGELKDGISHTLGLGRLSRQVFAPPLKVLVHDPYQALLDQKYRPKPVDEATLIRQFYKGQFSRESLSTSLGNQGYSEQYIDWLISDHQKFLSMDDIDYLVSRAIWTTDDATQYLQQQGWDSDSAARVVEVMGDKRIHKYRLQLVAAGETAFVKGDIAFDQWQNIVETAGLTDEEQTWILKVAGMKREMFVTHLSLGQIETGIKDGILNIGDLQTWATRNNMPADEESYLELITLFAVNKQTATEKAKAAAAQAKATAAQAKATAAAQKAAQAKALAPDKGVTVAQAETLVKDGLWTFDQLTSFLTAKGYGADAISGIVALLHNAIAKTTAGAATVAGVRATAAAKGLTLAEVEKAVVAGILSADDLTNYLAQHDFDAADTQVLVELTQEAAAAAKVKADAKAAASQKAAAKQISLAELEKAVRVGLTTMAAYNAALTAAGFDAMSITLLDGLLNDQIAADKAAAAKRSAAVASGAAKGITLAQLEQEVIQGIRPIADYTAALASLGYGASDVQDLAALLQLKVDQAKETAAKRAAAGQALAARGISLTQAETAVKLGVIPIGTYQQQLQASGFTPDAIDVLSNSLLADVAKTRKAQAAAATTGGTVATKAISLPALERAVIAGLQPIDTYSSTLTAAGYSAADVDTLTQLLQLKVDQAAAAAAAHADAEGNATRRGISLANEEAAVLAGDKTMDDYDALLSALGYDDIDRATLEDLLQKKVAAAAAKAGTGGSAATTGSGSAPAGSATP